MLYKIAINNSIHIPFLRKYFGFSFFNALPPPSGSWGGGKPLQGGALPDLPPPVCPPLSEHFFSYFGFPFVCIKECDMSMLLMEETKD